MSKSLKILIVEDEAMMAMLLKLSLQKLGYTICGIASTGEAAIASALETRPNLILMDLRLAGSMNGIEAMRQIRQDYECEVIFMTGYSDPQSRRDASDLHPLAFLVKPITPDELTRYLDKLSGDLAQQD